MTSPTTPSMIAKTTPGRAWTSLVLGVLILLVPLATGTTSGVYQSFATSAYVIGVAVIVLAGISIWAARNNLRALAWLEGVNALLGIAAIASPFVYTSTTNSLYSNVVLGLILVVVAGFDSYVGMTNARGTGTMTRRGRAT